MIGLSFVATLYIFVGGLGFLVNMVATAFLVNRPQEPLMPLTIYGLSDTLSGALTGIALFCDGSLYFANFVYRNSCSRYFLIYTLLVFPIIISNFSTLGVATERHQVIAVALPQPENFRRTFSLVWTVASWFIALAFIIMLWGHTMVFSVKAVHNNIFYWENEEIRHNRGLLENLWEHNSQQDWSTDYRENVIIGLIYGIVGGNISHDTLEQFRGVSQNEQIQPINLKKIKELHTALGINTEDLQRVFGEKLNENSQYKNQTNNTTLHTTGNLTENNKGTDTLLTQTYNNFKTFKPSSTEIVKNLTNNSSKHSSKPFQIKDVAPHGDLPEQVPQNSLTDRPPTTFMYLSLRDTETSDKHDVKQTNKSEISANASETLSTINTLNVFNTVGDSPLITNPESNTNSFPEENEEISSQLLSTEISSITVTKSDVYEKKTKTTQIYTQHSTEAHGEGQNYSSETPEDEKLLLTTVALSNMEITNIIPLQGTKFQSSTELYNNISNTNSNKIASNITTDKLTKIPNKNEAGFPVATNPGTLTKNLSIHSSDTQSRLPLTTTEEDMSTNPPPRTNFISTACQPQANFLPTFMTVLFILMFAVPLSVSAGLYAHTSWILYHQNPQSTDLAYSHTSHAKRATCQMVVILLANFGCWTPFMVERLLYAWGIVNNLSSVVPALLFFFGHTHSLLRGIFHIFDHKVVQSRISARPTVTMCNNGCTSSIIPMDEAIFNSSRQSNSSEENTQMHGNGSSSAFPVIQDSVHSNADNASLGLRGSTPPPTSANFNQLPNMVSHTSTSSNKRKE